MREVTFLKHNAESWKEFEQALQLRSQVDPDLLAMQFIKLTDDLAYARTYYPNSNTTKYLNELATEVHQRIYKNKKEKKSRFATFWKYEVPMAAYTLRKPIFYSFIIFFLSVLLGVISLWQDESFARLVLGDGYVNMTIENIKTGDPMGVYKSENELVMFLQIALNNIYVSLMVFVKGIFFSFGAAYELFRNGVMLGVFQYFFHTYGLLQRSALTVWIHGTLEISAIIIAGGAGLALGNSILFPGTYTRMYSLRKAAVNGIKIMLGLFPVFITAAFFEGFVTRHTEMPAWLSLLIISSSLAFIIFYFIMYPQRLNRKAHAQTSN